MKARKRTIFRVGRANYASAIVNALRKALGAARERPKIFHFAVCE
jgi:hypothetical protein